jgi:hypothetical protein
MAKRKQRELTQAEIWDDSALIRSWDEAVEEYKVGKSFMTEANEKLAPLQALSQHPR